MKYTDTIKQLSFTKVNIFLIVFLPISLLIGSLIINLNIILIIFLFFLDCKKRNNFLLFKEKSFFYLCIIWLYLIFNSLYVGDTSDSLVRSLGFIRFILLSFAIFFYLNIENKFYKKTIFKYWVYIFLIVSIDLIFEFIFGKNVLGFQSNYGINPIEAERNVLNIFGYQLFYTGRLASFTGDELKIGGFYFGFIAITLAFIYKYYKKSYIIFIIIFIIISLLIGERANFIRIILINFGFIFFVLNISYFKKIVFLFSLLIIGLIIIANMPSLKSKFYNHIFNIPYGTKISEKNYQIEEILKNKYFSHYYTAINIFKENPIFGVGLKEFRLESTNKKYSPIEGAYGVGMHPHQVHFEILSELGLIGYILIISNLFYIVVNVLKNNNQRDIFTKSSIIFIICTFVPLIPSGGFFTTYGASIYWINYSLLIATLIKKENYEKIFLIK